jgi:hypothetical protein
MGEQLVIVDAKLYIQSKVAFDEKILGLNFDVFHFIVV